MEVDVEGDPCGCNAQVVSCLTLNPADHPRD